MSNPRTDVLDEGLFPYGFFERNPRNRLELIKDARIDDNKDKPRAPTPPPLVFVSSIDDLERFEEVPRQVIKSSTIELKPRWFKKPTRVEMYGERHPDINSKELREIQNDTIRFLATRLKDDPNSVIFIEAPPGSQYEGSLQPRVMWNVGSRLKLLLKGNDKERVRLFDRRRDPEYAGISSPIDDATAEQLSKQIEAEISPLYKKFPKLRDIKDEHVNKQNVNHRGIFLSPLYDAQLIREIRKASKEGKNVITYTGDAHRSNVLRAMGKGFSSIQHGLVLRSYYNHK
jgi:hypothetical protein